MKKKIIGIVVCVLLIAIAFMPGVNAEDENTNQVSDDEESTVVIGFPPITMTEPAPVGGYTLPVNNLAILTPYMGLIGLIGLASATFFFRKRSRA